MHLTAATGLAYSFARRKDLAAAWEVTRSIGDVFARRNLGATVWMFRLDLMRAEFFLEAGLLDSAEAACEDAFDRSTPLTRPAASRILAEIHLRRGEYERALDACDDALRVNPNAPMALLTLARVYRAQGDAGMTREIATRLKLLWKDADPDFRELPALEELLRAVPPAS
jgi:tetratricopeptide (TPR) repeat protein